MFHSLKIPGLVALTLPPLQFSAGNPSASGSRIRFEQGGGMRRQSAVKAIRTLVVVAVPFLAVSAWSAGAPTGSEHAADEKRVQEWMSRLVGMFRVEGSVDLPGETAAIKGMSIRGQADCRGIRPSGPAPAPRSGLPPGMTPKMAPEGSGGVECFLETTWTQSSVTEGTATQDVTPALRSAVLLYAHDRFINGVRHMQVDDTGTAEGGAAQLSGNTLALTAECASSRGKCVSRVSIAAAPDGQSVRMEMNMEVDGKRVGGRLLTLRREPVSP